MNENTTGPAAKLLRGAARATIRYLMSSQGWERLTLAEEQFHTGDDPIRADHEAHAVFEQYVQAHQHLVGDSVYAVVGEESIQVLPDRFEPGTRVVVVDPLDGSTQWAILAQGYCVAAYSLVAGATGALQLETAVVVNPQHSFVWRSDREGFEFRTSRGSASRLITQSTVPESPFLAPSIAFTGFKSKDRRAALELGEAFGDWHVLPLGGNPVTPYVVSAGLTAALTLRPQASWDALGILLASKTDAVIGALDGTLLMQETFRELFERVVLEGNVRRVPALIVAKSQRRFEEIVERVAPLLSDDLTLSPSHPG